MENKENTELAHLLGEEFFELLARMDRPDSLDTFRGKVHVEWDPDAAVTPLGQLPYFINFLKAADLFSPWVDDCPLTYKSPNAPAKVDVLGTIFLSALSGHRRYAHITSLRSDSVSPELLGMNKVMSEDSVRRAFQNMDESDCLEWQRRHLHFCYGPLLHEPWILDVDTTVKPLYGKQEGAEVGFNPHKPGRPSHTYHTYFIANLRLVLDVEVHAGNQTAASYSRPGLWSLLERLDRSCWPEFIRGDCAWGNEQAMLECEDHDLRYLFKLRQTKGVRALVERLLRGSNWTPAGQGFEGVESRLKLAGWSKSRRVVVLRRRIRDDVAVSLNDPDGQLEFGFVEKDDLVKYYEYAVLVTDLGDPILTIAQHYRDRADCENNFDELKNHWGWGGFTTKDLKRCRIIASMVALIYNWWSLYVRLAIPDRHAEAITSRPLLLHGIGRLTRHAGQTKLSLTSSHGKSGKIKLILDSLGRLFNWFEKTAEHLDRIERWRLLLSIVFRHFLKGRLLLAPILLGQVVNRGCSGAQSL